ncbi:SH3 domain-containing protein [Leptospira congkakensis]|uniref:SH3 domain-containing protein n=2 Tax=Leptospira congkakensis TaxID=2484932 RepID=A0A4Z1AA85_9LEPT|nr:SH3 domain-containing protein [Leptospira congkakensis]TGL88544.1 SH3 domain-containing protein [Leptospira congkakensis]TGL89130.1 SH3 domain-containing protein [Leptospira congkakensis]TGL97096.1 SH3 domain-containing protein [Leptospira congkakensis]
MKPVPLLKFFRRGMVFSPTLMSLRPMFVFCIRLFNISYLFLVLFFVMSFTSLLAEPKLKEKSKQTKPSELLKRDLYSEIVIPVIGLNLHLFADQKSDVLRKLKFGEPVSFDKDSLESPKEDWIPVKLEDGLSGFIKRSVVRSVLPKQYLSTLLFEAERMVLSKNIDFGAKQEITDTIFQISSTGKFTGDDFIFIRAKAGYFLKKTVDVMNEKGIKPDNDPATLEFLKRHQTKLLYDYNSRKYYVDSNYFWKLLESYPKTKHSDYAGYLATESNPSADCGTDLKCRLEEMRKGKLRYIYLFPTGNYINLYTKDLVSNLQSMTKDPDSIPCFAPVGEGIKSEINQMIRYTSEIGPREKKQILPHLQILKKECFR